MTLTEQQARKNLQGLIAKYNALSLDDRKEMSEASVVRQFIDILLRDVLDWPIEDTARYKYEKVTQVGRPDMMLMPESGGTIFVEAKRFGIVKELQEARKTTSGIITPGQMALPGMAIDRTPEEQQAINYAFANNGTWAILTNFEKLRLFNARRDWLVLSFETPSAYDKDFDYLWELAYPNVLNGSLDRLSNQRMTAEIDADYLRFINEWREKLAQDILRGRADNPWAFESDGSVNLQKLRSVVQRILDRLVILRFAEDHLVIPAGTLRSFYELGRQNRYADLNMMTNTLYRRFDKAHNSALFAPDDADQAVFSDETLIGLLSKLYEARYRSMSADIMGNTYEQYLGKTLVRRDGSIATADNLETRKKQGSYYTPQVIVRYIVDNSLGRYLYGTENGQPDGTPVPGEARKTSAEIHDLRVLDSACGSGSFLIYAYEVLNGFYQNEIARLEAERQARLNELIAAGITEPLELQIQLARFKAELERIANPARLILETHLYGVDLDPQAAEIAVVNLMMRGMERRQTDQRLPLILNQNVKVGNALIGLRPDDPRLIGNPEIEAQIAKIIALRADLIRVPHNTPEHDQIVIALQAASDNLSNPLTSAIYQQFWDTGIQDVTERIHPFCWGVEFPEVFFDAAGKPLANPGFTIVLGNPPWEILKPDLREFYAQFDPDIESRLNRTQAEARIAALDAEDPTRRALFTTALKATEQTALHVRRSGEFTRQGRGDLATHKLFLEHMYSLLRREGRIGYVVPSGIYTDLGTKELREMLLNEGNIQYIFSFSNERFFFPGVHHSFKFALIGAQKGQQSEGFWSVFRFNPRVAVAPDDLPALLADKSKLIYVRRDSLAKFSPDSLSVMEFQEPQDYEVTKKIYGDWPLLNADIEGQFGVVRLNREFDMTNDRELFNQNEGPIMVYTGSMIHQYDANYATPEIWISNEKSKDISPATREQIQHYRLAYRRIARSTDTRSFIAAVVPPNTICDTVAIIEQSQSSLHTTLYLDGIFNSLVLDYILRGKIATTVNMFYVYSLPVPRLTAGNPYFDAIVPRAAKLTCTRAEFADLWVSVMGTPWDNSQGTSDPAERQRLRDEIDGIVARLYGLSRGDFDHILGTFPLVFPDTDAGRARRSALLSVYDTLNFSA
jgi:hypothetical protein